MSPLQTFHRIAAALLKKPFAFWPEADQKKILDDATSAITRLKKMLETKELTDTHAYKELVVLEKNITTTGMKEVSFIQHLGNLIDIYKLSRNKKGIEELLDKLSGEVTKAKKILLEHHLALEALAKKAKKMTPEAKKASDDETIKKVGLFYVLEYTLQVLFEFTKRTDAEKKKLMVEGLVTKAGSLPAYAPLEATFRKELCYKIFDETIRDRLLKAFYKFEEVCYGEDVGAIERVLKQFNIEVLQTFKDTGLQTFKGFVYTPFGNELPIDELIQRIEAIKL